MTLVLFLRIHYLEALKIFSLIFVSYSWGYEILTHFPFLLKILLYQTAKSENNVSPFKTIQHQNFLLREKSPRTITHFTTHFQNWFSGILSLHKVITPDLQTSLPMKTTMRGKRSEKGNALSICRSQSKSPTQQRLSAVFQNTLQPHDLHTVGTR